MLTIMLPASGTTEAATLTFEHSLVSVSKWESIHQKAFFGKDDKTPEETESYIKQMLLSENPPEDFVDKLSGADYVTITEYINAQHSATWFREDRESKGSAEVVTSELIYYWMIQFNIPFHPCQDWHLNRLMTLIKIAGIKQSKPKKRSRQSIAEEYREMNAKRRQQLGTAG